MKVSRFVPNERAIRVCQLADEYLVITMAHIIALIFAECSSLTQAYVCVQRLIDNKYLDIAGYLPAKNGRGSQTRCLILGPRGRQLLCDLADIPVFTKKRSTREASPLFLAHTVTLSTIHLAITLAAKAHTSFRLVNWKRDDELAASPIGIKDPIAPASTITIVPDARIVVSYEGKQTVLLLETDMGTAALKRIAIKLRAYLSLIAATPSLSLLYVSATPERQRAVRTALAAEVKATGIAPSALLLTTKEQVSRETILTAPIFAMAGEREQVFLLDYLARRRL